MEAIAVVQFPIEKFSIQCLVFCDSDDVIRYMEYIVALFPHGEEEAIP